MMVPSAKLSGFEIDLEIRTVRSLCTCAPLDAGGGIDAGKSILLEAVAKIVTVSTCAAKSSVLVVEGERLTAVSAVQAT